MSKAETSRELVQRASHFLHAAQSMPRNDVHGLLLQAPQDTFEVFCAVAELGREYVQDNIWYTTYDPIQVISARRTSKAADYKRPREVQIRELLTSNHMRRWVSRGLHVLQID